MYQRKDHICPECNGEMESGFLGFYGGLYWHTRKPRGLGRFFLAAVESGRLVAGSMLSSGFVSTLQAQRCKACGTILFRPLAAAKVRQAEPLPAESNTH